VGNGKLSYSARMGKKRHSDARAHHGRRRRLGGGDTSQGYLRDWGVLDLSETFNCFL